MWQSPAIFWQHAISAAVICGLGRHASAGVATHMVTKPNTKIERQHAITECYTPLRAKATMCLDDNCLIMSVMTFLSQLCGECVRVIVSNRGTPRPGYL